MTSFPTGDEIFFQQCPLYLRMSLNVKEREERVEENGNKGRGRGEEKNNKQMDLSGETPQSSSKC